MRKLISLFMILALVVVTTMPASVSHAMPQSGVESTQLQVSDKGDCHKHSKAEQSGKTTQNDKDSGKCCDKGMCKCVGSTCHNGMSKIFGNGSTSLLSLTFTKTDFNFTTDAVESALLKRLKRPPKS